MNCTRQSMEREIENLNAELDEMHKQIWEYQRKLLAYEGVVPAKHGRWAEVKKRTVIYPDNCLEQLEVLGFLHRTEQQLQCSLCREVTMVDDTIVYSYCPHCGAKMDEVSE